MENFYELASKRRSIRKYKDTPIPLDDIEFFIKSAITAPSGCNSQCWEFIAVINKNIIDQMVESVKEANSAFYANTGVEQSYIENKGKAATFFKNAPLVIAVFMTKLEYYDSRTVGVFHQKGYDEKSIMSELSYPDVLSVGAAVQNLLLAVQEKGYGACWMNEPAIADKKMNQILGVSEEHKFMSLIPVGIPAYAPRTKVMKDMTEVFRIIE